MSYYTIFYYIHCIMSTILYVFFKQVLFIFTYDCMKCNEQQYMLDSAGRRLTSESSTIEEEGAQVTPSLSTDVDTPRCRPVTPIGLLLWSR